MWFFWSIITAVLESAKDLTSKQNTVKSTEFEVSFAYEVFGILVLIPFLLITGIPTIQPIFWPYVIIESIIKPVWIILYIKALKLSPVSVTLPILAFNPVFVMLLGVFFEGKFPNTVAILGVLLITIGIYVNRLNPQTFKSNPLEPILSIRKEKGTLYMFLVGLIWSFVAHITTIETKASSPIFGAFMSSVISSIILILVVGMDKNSSFSGIKSNFKDLFLNGTLNGVSKITIRLALGLAPLTVYVMSIKRTSIVMSSIAGKLFLNESMGRTKFLGVIILIIGVIILTLASA